MQKISQLNVAQTHTPFGSKWCAQLKQRVEFLDSIVSEYYLNRYSLFSRSWAMTLSYAVLTSVESNSRPYLMFHVNEKFPFQADVKHPQWTTWHEHQYRAVWNPNAMDQHKMNADLALRAGNLFTVVSFFILYLPQICCWL